MDSARKSVSGIRTDIKVPKGLKHRWQPMLDVASRVVDSPVSRVTLVHETELEFFVCNKRARNAFPRGRCYPLANLHYCETVVRTRADYLIRDARTMPEWTGSADLKRGMVSYFGLPLLWPSGELFGTVGVLDEHARSYTALQRATLRQLRLSMEKDLALIDANERLRNETSLRKRAQTALQKTRAATRTASRQLQLRAEHERSELGRGLHDEIAQGLTAVKMDLSACASALPQENLTKVRPSLDSIMDALDGLVLSTRQICDSLVPPVLEDLGPASAIEWEMEEYARKTGIPCTIRRLDDLSGMAPSAAAIIYRSFQHALERMVTAGPLSAIAVEVKHTKTMVVVTISATGSEGLPADGQPIQVADLVEHVRSWGGHLRTWNTPDNVRMLQLSMPFDVSAQVPE